MLGRFGCEVMVFVCLTTRTTYRQLISIVDFFQQELLLQALIFLNQAHVDDGKMDTLRSWIDELLTHGGRHVDQTFLVACSNINN